MNIRRFDLIIVPIFALLTTTAIAESFDYGACFDTVWNTFNQQFWDTTFSGVDWRAKYHEYLPRAKAASTDSAFYRTVNQMIWELGLTHSGIVPPDQWAIVEPNVFLSGELGFDVRYIDGNVIVINVIQGLPADLAGIQIGDRIISIDGKLVSNLARDRLSKLEPPFNKRLSLTNEMRSWLRGKPRTSVTLGLADSAVILQRVEYGYPFMLSGVFPTTTTFEEGLLAGNIGYVHFNWFHPRVNARMGKYLSANKALSGLIIDLRGNPGGMREIAQELIRYFINDTIKPAFLLRRSGPEDVVISPADIVYDGPVAILVDVMSTSGSEYFTGIMQHIGRATVIGEQTPGALGPADLKVLASGATIVYPFAQTQLRDGTVLEGRGVIPDINAPLDVVALENGQDNQLDVATKLLLQDDSPSDY